jgi:curved DNA-binding protein CbpA
MEQYYKLLNCNVHTPLGEVKKKYTTLMKQTHPDKGCDDHLCKLINEAYQKIIEFKLNMGVDISENTMPIFFKAVNYKNIPKAMKYVEKRLMDKETKKSDYETTSDEKDVSILYNDITLSSDENGDDDENKDDDDDENKDDDDDDSEDETFFKDIYNFFFK